MSLKSVVICRKIKFYALKKGSTMLKIGDLAPALSLPNQDDVEISRRDLEGKWIVLYF